jgi:hypothetical protein
MYQIKGTVGQKIGWSQFFDRSTETSSIFFLILNIFEKGCRSTWRRQHHVSISVVRDNTKADIKLRRKFIAVIDIANAA